MLDDQAAHRVAGIVHAPAAASAFDRARAQQRSPSVAASQPSGADIGEQLRLMVGDQRRDHLVDFALHHPVELVERQVDAVVGHAGPAGNCRCGCARSGRRSRPGCRRDSERSSSACLRSMS